jgi:hypothetical protein
MLTKVSSLSLTRRDLFGYAYLRVDRYAAQSAPWLEYCLCDLRPESRNFVSDRFQRLFSTPQRAVDFTLNFQEKSTFQNERSTFCCYIKCHPTCGFQTGPIGHPMWYPRGSGLISSWVKPLRRETNHSTSVSIQVKNMWFYTSANSYVSFAWCLSTGINLTLHFLLTWIMMWRRDVNSSAQEGAVWTRWLTHWLHKCGILTNRWSKTLQTVRLTTQTAVITVMWHQV